MIMNQNQFEELIPFLRDRNPQVRQIALENLLPQTVAGAPCRDIFFSGLQSGGIQPPKENNVIHAVKILCMDQLSIAHDAFRALINLSDSPLIIVPLSEKPFMNFLVSYIINPHSILADLASMLLSNLTAMATPCSILLSMKIPVVQDTRMSNSFYPVNSRCGSCPAPVPFPAGESQEVVALPLLIQAFSEGAQLTQDLSKRTRKAELHFLANVFANATVSPLGRTYFLSPQPVDPARPNALEYPLAKIVVFTEHSSKIRRGGVASTIKNCAFHVPGHKAILSPETAQLAVPPSDHEAPGIDVLPFILLPLAGPEEYDLADQERLLEILQFLPPTKKREPDAAIRLTHVETLLLLCHTFWGRNYQRQHGVYQIVRLAHENESVDKVSEHIERLVQLIHGAEPKVLFPDDESTEIDSMVLVQPHHLHSVATSAVPNDQMSDDEDMRIEEI